MAQKLTASMPEDLDLDEKYTIRFTALDPTTGAAVSGVVVSNLQIHCTNLSAVPDADLAAGAFQLIPIDELNGEEG